MLSYRAAVSVLTLCLTIGSLVIVEAQVYDRFERSDGENQDNQGLGGRFRNMMSVNVPLFYDMVKNGNSMGINVLSGLVKVERGEEAERSGLVGPRPLSVRVFGIPVYERGTRVRPLEQPFRPAEGPVGPEGPLGGGSAESEGPRPARPKEPAGSEDELPIIP